MLKRLFLESPVETINDEMGEVNQPKFLSDYAPLPEGTRASLVEQVSSTLWKIKVETDPVFAASITYSQYQSSEDVLTPEEEQAQMEEEMRSAQVPINIEKIWQAAHDYEFQQISGSAIGLLTIGVQKHMMDGSCTKSFAVQTWIASIWDQYYSNKFNLENGVEFDESMLDYTACGDIPYSVPELRQELGM